MPANEQSNQLPTADGVPWPWRNLPVLAGCLLVPAIHFGFYDPISQSPEFLKPARLIVYAVLLLLATNILFFSFNLIKTLLGARGMQDEDEVERVVAPALQGDIQDERVIRWMIVPFRFEVGLIFGGIAVAIVRAFQR